MKTAIVIFCLVLNFSCNQDASTSKVSKNNSVDLKISDNPDIFGTWTMCATSGNGMMIQMNTCKTIVFNNNGTGHVGNSSLITENFVWTLKNPGMKIIYNNSNSDFTFSDTFYYANFTKRENRTDLILTHKDNSFYLSK
jgi:hypothetical protein